MKSRRHFSSATKSSCVSLRMGFGKTRRVPLKPVPRQVLRSTQRNHFRSETGRNRSAKVRWLRRSREESGCLPTIPTSSCRRSSRFISMRYTITQRQGERTMSLFSSSCKGMVCPLGANEALWLPHIHAFRHMRGPGMYETKVLLRTGSTEEVPNRTHIFRRFEFLLLPQNQECNRLVRQEGSLASLHLNSFEEMRLSTRLHVD